MALFDFNSFMNKINEIVEEGTSSITHLSQAKRDIQLLGAPVPLIVERLSGLEYLSSSIKGIPIIEGFYKTGHFGHALTEAQSLPQGVDVWGVDFLTRDAWLNPTDWLGLELQLRWKTSNSNGRALQSRLLVVQSIRLINQDGGVAHYRVILAPSWAALTQTVRSKIYADIDSIAIVESILGEYGITLQSEVQTHPAVRRRVTQYNETDFAFVSRILSEDGISFMASHQVPSDSDPFSAGWDLAQPPKTEGKVSLLIADAAGLSKLAQTAPYNLGSIQYGLVSSQLSDERLNHVVLSNHAITTQVQRGAWSSRDVHGQAWSAPLPDLQNLPHLQRIDGITNEDDGSYAVSGDGGFKTDPQLALYASFLQQHRQLTVNHVIASGGVRSFIPNGQFTLTEHDHLAGQRFSVLAVRHEAANSSGYTNRSLPTVLHHLTHSADEVNETNKKHYQLLNSLEAGSYRAWVVLSDASYPIVPEPIARPSLPLMTGIVQNLAGNEQSDTDRDHRVYIKIPVLADAQSDSHSGIDQRIPSAEYIAGPNYGSMFSHTPNDEVLVGNLGSADSLVVLGGFPNTANPLPLPPVENQATQSGYKAKGTSSEQVQWIFEDSPKQPYQTLNTTSSGVNASLTQGQITLAGQQGIELFTTHQGMLRTGQALWVNTHTAPTEDDRQHDARPLYGLLKGTAQQAQSMIDLVPSLSEIATTTESVKQLTEALKPLAEQQNTDLSSLQTHFETPYLLIDSASDTAITGGDGINLHSGESMELWANEDITATAQDSMQIAVSEALAILANKNLSGIAATGDVELSAHTGAMNLLASKDVQISSSESTVKILAKDKIVLSAGGAIIELNGGDITITANSFSSKATQTSYGGGGSGASALPALPIVNVKPEDLVLEYKHHDGDPVQGAPFEVTFADGSKRNGVLDATGKAVLKGVPAGAAKVKYGDDVRRSGSPNDNPERDDWIA